MIGLVFASALVLAQNTLAAPAVAPPAAAAPAADPAANDPTKAHRDQLLCKSEQVLGTLIPKKVCYTREQEEARRQEDRRNTEHLQESQYSTRNH